MINGGLGFFDESEATLRAMELLVVFEFQMKSENGNFFRFGVKAN